MISGQLEELEEEVWLIMVTSSNRTYLIVELVVELALQTIHSTVYMHFHCYSTSSSAMVCHRKCLAHVSGQLERHALSMMISETPGLVYKCYRFDIYDGI